ncbi:4Fe-4S binding protein [Sulfurovum sp.]|jgi:polyferredoxin|uniref:4Fe-4S binding protein n=1 Tax=Sulfurovum sp. TaxID=1969726 RepID=UPI002A35CAC2|nr:4Fe-4S binding protein [Sulfurovum sp.]MDY0403210.1 4Fe-4S binding protein [Sulfurovum sp.]
MQKIKKMINNMNLQKVRFIIQLFSFILFVYGGYFAIDLGSKLPIFACPYNGEAAGACYLIPLQHQLSMPAQILLGGAGIAVITGLLGFLFWFIFLNKAWCGYVCPFGTLQDWLTYLRKSMGIRYSTYSQSQFEKLSKVKYIFLAIVILFPLLMGVGLLGGEWSAAFCQMCPARIISPTLNGDFSQWTIDFSTKTAMVLTTLGILFSGLFFVGSFVKKRFFCFFCPMSALHYIFSKFSIVQLRKEGSKCTRCGDCYAVCDMQIKDIADNVTDVNILRDDCILCLKCVAACPEEDALHFDILNFRAFSSTKEGFEKRMGIKN